MKSTFSLTILFFGIASFGVRAADEQTSIPLNHQEAADKTYAAGKRYYIWPTTNGPITSSKVTGLEPGRDTPVLIMPLNFKAKDDVPEPFWYRIMIVTTSEDSGTGIQRTNTMTVGDLNTKGKANGRMLATYLPLNLPPGKGEAMIHLVRESDKDKVNATPISNELTIKVVVKQ